MEQLKDDAINFVNGDETNLSFHEWIIEERGLPNHLEFSLSGERPREQDDPAIEWLQENVPFHEFMNMVEVCARTDPGHHINIMQMLRNDFFEYKDMPNGLFEEIVIPKKQMKF